MTEQEFSQSLGENFSQPRGIVGRNPVFEKEIRGLIRQQRSRSVIIFYLVVLAVIAFLLYITIISANAVSPDPDVRRRLGKIIFLAITLAQLIAIIFIAPLFSADTITTERENKTFELLRITSVSASYIVRGKLFAGIMFTLLLLLISLPLQSGAYLLGGITPSEFLVSTVLLIVTTIFLCTISIWASTQSKRTSSAIGLAYTIASAVLLGLPILAYVIIRLAPIPSDQGLFIALQTVLKNLDPAFQAIFIVIIWFLISSNPISTAIITYSLFLDEGVRILYDLTAFKVHFPFIAPWITFILLYLILSWPFYRASVRQIEKR